MLPPTAGHHSAARATRARATSSAKRAGAKRGGGEILSLGLAPRRRALAERIARPETRAALERRGRSLSLARGGGGGRERERARRARGGGGTRTLARWLICAPAAINSSTAATWPRIAAQPSAVQLTCARAGGRIGGAGGGVTSGQFSLVRDPLPRAPRGGWCVCVEVWARMDQPRRRDRAAAERSAESAPPRRTRADGQNHFSAKPGSS